MRNKVTSVGVISLIVFYCFAIGFVNPYPLSKDVQSHTDSKRDYYSTVKAALHYHVSPSESVVHTAGNYTAPGFNHILFGPGILLLITEQLFESAFFQYSNRSRNFLVRYRKADLIFPFHYFW